MHSLFILEIERFRYSVEALPDLIDDVIVESPSAKIKTRRFDEDGQVSIATLIYVLYISFTFDHQQ